MYRERVLTLASFLYLYHPTTYPVMYQYSEFIPCRKEEVLKRLSQEEIYLLVLDQLPPVNTYVTSPFRKDNKPGCYFMWYNGILYFKDFGDPNYQMRDCFQAVMDKMHLTFKECLLFLNDYFQLGLNSGSSKPILFNDVIVNNKANKSMPGKITKVGDVRLSDEIIYKARGFFPIDKNYWYDRYEIKRSNLIEDNVFAGIWYQFYSKKGVLVTIRPSDIMYAYSDFYDGRTKIYRPLSPDKVGKWLTNCKADDVGGIRRLPRTGKQLFIKKSYKDYRVVKNEGFNVVWFQNEGMFPNDEIIIDLCLRFEKLIVIFDNDDKGIVAGLKLIEKINSLSPNKAVLKYISKQFKDAKDPSDLRHKYGRTELNKFLNNST